MQLRSVLSAMNDHQSIFWSTPYEMCYGLNAGISITFTHFHPKPQSEHMKKKDFWDIIS